MDVGKLSGWCGDSVWRVWGVCLECVCVGCLEDFERLSRGCGDAVWRMWGGSLEGVWRLSGCCLVCVGSLFRGCGEAG